MLPSKVRFIWPNGFGREELKKSANQKQESPVAVMFVTGSGRNDQYLQRTIHRCFLSSFGSFSQAVSKEKIFKNRTIRATLVSDWLIFLILLFRNHLAK
jgi:hypothetical protein